MGGSAGQPDRPWRWMQPLPEDDHGPVVNINNVSTASIAVIDFVSKTFWLSGLQSAQPSSQYTGKEKWGGQKFGNMVKLGGM